MSNDRDRTFPTPVCSRSPAQHHRLTRSTSCDRRREPLTAGIFAECTKSGLQSRHRELTPSSVRPPARRAFACPGHLTAD